MRGSRFFSIVLLLASAQLVGQDTAFIVQERSRAHHAGEVLRLTVETSLEVDQVRASGLGRTFFGAQTASGQWTILVGIDLNTEPGEYLLEIKGRSAAGTSLQQPYPVTVEAKEFPTRRLTVDEKFVNPPSKELDRIREERRRLSGIFSSVTKRSLWSGAFVSPVPGVATSGFGKRSILNGQPRSPHSGTDFDADQGTPVLAPNSGKVVLVDDLYYTGKTVVLDHGLGLYSLFAHLSETGVETGQTVSRNDLLGRVGATGRVTGPHLHWTVRLNTARVDPLALLAVTDDQ